MDLVYANEKNEELGVLKAYTFDLAYGVDENDFSLQMPLPDHCIEQGYFIYADGTEYGGVVDRISVDNKANLVTYSGRTWHGILSKAIITPPSGYDYYMASGDANAIIGQIVKDLGLDDIFEAKTEECDIDVGEYQFARYVDAYTGIRQMLAQFDGKLLFKHERGKVILSAEFLIDYSVDEEWDSSQLGFQILRNYRPINHLICLGQGDLRDRAVIHLFTDENGGLQNYYSALCPYVTDADGGKTYLPTNDSHYILDTSGQVMFGVDEVADVYDLSGAEITENYVPLKNQPKNWAKTYANYYTLSNGMYVEAEPVDSYTVLSSQPSGWASNYAKYYAKKGTQYDSVEGVEQAPIYTQLTKKPNNWANAYEDYFYYYSDGVTSEYRGVDGDTKYRYKVQTEKPTDWNDKATSLYYQKKKNGGYEKVKLTSKKKIPSWKAKKYYTRESYKVAPDWEKTTKSGRKYYSESVSTVAPTFAPNKYYTLTENVPPAFVKGKYYEIQEDRIASLIEGGLEVLQESWNCDEISINLGGTEDYDIGDVVGANDNVTGIMVWQPITKKIVTIEKGRAIVTYEIGGK